MDDPASAQLSPGALLERLAWLNKHIDGLARERHRLRATPYAEWNDAVPQRIRHLTAWLEDAYAEKRETRTRWGATREDPDDVVPGLRAKRRRVRTDS